MKKKINIYCIRTEIVIYVKYYFYYRNKMLSRNLTKEYIQIYSKFGGNPFTIHDVPRLIDKPLQVARQDVFKLKKELTLVHKGRGIYKVLPPEKWICLTIALQNRPELRKFFQKLLDNIETIDALFLIGSRARGDYRRDSDYDFLILTRDRGTALTVESKSGGSPKIEVEAYPTQSIEKNLELDPLYLLSGFKEAETIYGEGLRRHFTSYKPTMESIIAPIEKTRKRLKGWHELIPDADTNTKADIIYACMLRVRQAYLASNLNTDALPRIDSMLDEFSEYYRNREQLMRFYEVYRQSRDAEEGEDFKGEVEANDEELQRLVEATNKYMLAVEDEITS